VLTEDAPEAESISPADQALDLLRANHLQHDVEARVSFSRWAVPVVLIALAIGLVWTYSPVLKRKDYGVRLAQQHTEAKAASKAMIAGGKARSAVPDNTQANAFSTRGQESPHVATGPPASASAQTLSGIRVLEQNGGPPDGGEATTSFQHAVLSGDPNAQFELGAAYALGRGVPADPVTGYTWLTLAFANGDRQAETLIRELTRKLNQSEIARIRWNVGEMYANGVGVHPDKVTAYMWHLLAESAGETRRARSQLASTMTDDERSEARARASQWLRKHHR
jgi:TPR repeat protein